MSSPMYQLDKIEVYHPTDKIKKKYIVKQIDSLLCSELKYTLNSTASSDINALHFF